jgi:hypothetical protein
MALAAVLSAIRGKIASAAKTAGDPAPAGR